jgi:hypothetical protein
MLPRKLARLLENGGRHGMAGIESCRKVGPVRFTGRRYFPGGQFLAEEPQLQGVGELQLQNS